MFTNTCTCLMAIPITDQCVRDTSYEDVEVPKIESMHPVSGSMIALFNSLRVNIRSWLLSYLGPWVGLTWGLVCSSCALEVLSASEVRCEKCGCSFFLSVCVVLSNGEAQTANIVPVLPSTQALDRKAPSSD